MGHWKSRSVWFLLLTSSFCQRISFSPSTDKLLGDWHVNRGRCTELFSEFPRFELGWRWRCRRDRDSEGDGDSRGDGDAEGNGDGE